jgi:hypothetical protein
MSSTPQYLVTAAGEVRLRGEIQFPGGSPLDTTPIFSCPAGTTPSQLAMLLAIEDVNPARSYRVDIGVDGVGRLRYPERSTSGSLILDPLCWFTS